MPTDWKPAVTELSGLVRNASADQLSLAATIKLPLSPELPWLVAGARLRVALASELAVHVQLLPTDYQASLLQDLSRDLRTSRPMPGSRTEAEAWIRYLYLKRRLRALRRLKPVSGDVVRDRLDPPEEVSEISSVGTDGRLYFRGGRTRAWPDRVEMLARASDRSAQAEDLRKRARNLAAARSTNRDWSLARASALRRYEVPEGIDSGDLEALRQVIDDASNEAPIQRLIQERPRLLASLVRGPQRYVIPKAPMGLSHVTDFLLATVDSIGVRWILVELETPCSGIGLKTKNDFDEVTRTGLSQIREWREWLQNNLANAQQPRERGGLGLFDIRPQADGLVLVGRRAFLQPAAEQLRAQVHEKDHIVVHTYDWLAEQLRGVLAYAGPPATNPYLLQPGTSLDPDPDWF